jgi:hypothetical protein
VDDKEVLCIDCILSDHHKTHEIVSVAKAVESQKQSLYDSVMMAEISEDKLKCINDDIRRHLADMHLLADKNRKEISVIYNQAREIIMEREQHLKRQISEHLEKEEQDCDGKVGELNSIIYKIAMLKQEIVASASEDEIEILRQAKKRSHMCDEVKG